MKLFDKLKQGIKAVTGGAAKVTIEWEPKTVVPGQSIAVKVFIQSAGGEVKSKGVFVDFHGDETFLAPPEKVPALALEPKPAGATMTDPETTPPVTGKSEEITEAAEPAEPQTDTKRICAETFTLCNPFVLGENESKQVEGNLKLPDHLSASSDEELGCHYRIRGRMEAFGNDPDSGYKEITVVAAPSPGA